MFQTNCFAEAVRHAIHNTDIGYRSSILSLVNMACAFYTGKEKKPHQLHKQAANIRGVERIKLGQHINCSTYEGQPRRDMRNDNKLSFTNFFKAHELTKKVSIDELRTFLNCFHSIDQAHKFVDAIEDSTNFFELE